MTRDSNKKRISGSMARVESSHRVNRGFSQCTDGSTVVARAICASPHHVGPRWLLAMEFHRHPHNKTGLQSYCRTCVKISKRVENLTDEQRQAASERSRERHAVARRQRGVQPRRLKNPTPKYGAGRTMSTHEFVRAGPLRDVFAEIGPLTDNQTTRVARAAGLTTQEVIDALRPRRRLILLDQADRILIAVGISTSEVYPDTTTRSRRG